ncbi:MAG TPA: cobyric acid synthase [Nitrospirae bacterium]|nr:cobyric acid synthase [Nitrospirota bacterium]HDZ00881.1 cobyric acid synthase [Nitrospirota bacterium]
MSKAIMIQGTGSGAGKSVIVAGLCRIFRDMGIRVAPFKSQNMALNSFITKEGGEIGRAQAFQAEAAGIEPCNDMNPVLLKATGEAGCQVILNGKVYATMKADEYYAIKDEVWKEITAAYDRLSKEYELIVIEGAGSPAEINLQAEEVVNMRVARYADAPVILVGDIDRGGVFAQFYGTVELLKDAPLNPPLPRAETNGLADADYIKAFIVNKFRGDMDILRPGLRMIEKKTGKLVIGTLYYQNDLGLDEEDGLSIERVNRLEELERLEHHRMLKIVVLRLKYIANFTDLAPFLYEPDVEIKYSLWEEDINSADLIIIPGSKNTVADLLLLRESGIEKCVKFAVKKGTPLVGICGGYQMLGQKILDPYKVESSLAEVEGMGLLDTVTTLDRTKTTCRVWAEINDAETRRRGDAEKSPVPRLPGSPHHKLKGYEIHMGNTTGDVGLFKLTRRSGNVADSPCRRFPVSPAHSVPASAVLDGSVKGNVWGTYIHGIFDNDDLRAALLDSLREKKGLPAHSITFSYQAQREEAINKWADTLKNSVDICFILRQAGMEYCMKKTQEDLK